MFFSQPRNRRKQEFVDLPNRREPFRFRSGFDGKRILCEPQASGSPGCVCVPSSAPSTLLLYIVILSIIVSRSFIVVWACIRNIYVARPTEEPDVGTFSCPLQGTELLSVTCAVGPVERLLPRACVPLTLFFGSRVPFSLVDVLSRWRFVDTSIYYNTRMENLTTTPFKKVNPPCR